jgi:hypothetical protein
MVTVVTLKFKNEEYLKSKVDLGRAAAFGFDL